VTEAEKLLRLFHVRVPLNEAPPSGEEPEIDLDVAADAVPLPTRTSAIMVKAVTRQAAILRRTLNADPP
jgi:hypothetical protein